MDSFKDKVAVVKEKGLLLSLVLLLSVSVSAQDVEGFINRQMQNYP